MKRILGYMKKYSGFYVIAMLAMITSITLDMFSPPLIRRIVDDVIVGKKMELLQGALIGLAGITFGRAVFGYIRGYTFDYTCLKVITKLRKDIFDHIQKLSFTFFDNSNTGELMSRIKEDAENVQYALSFGIMLFIEQVIYFVVASTIMFIVNWKLAIVGLITMPIIGFLALKLEGKVGKAFEKISDQRAVMNTTAQENIAGVRLVKAFGREKYEVQKFLKQNRQNYELNVEQAAIWAKYFPMLEFLSNIVMVLVICAGGYLIIRKEVTIGVLVAFTQYIYMLIWPMRMIGWLTSVLAQCKASVGKIEEIFAKEPSVQSVENPETPRSTDGHIVFEDVCFEFNGTQVLKNINIDAKPGSTVAIMGATGSGKSSIVNLMGRFYDCSSGRISLDGVDIKRMNLNALRKQISYVMQDTFLFSDTIEENIRFGPERVSKDDLVAAAKAAKVNDFVIQTPEGYQTVIGERGIGLSGGQKQRISIARALIKDSRVLILDDSTSALDMETEYEMQKALEERKGVTKFIIAHRVSAVKNADEILILEDGEIVERGTHSQLLELKGRYYETYCEQFMGAMEIPEEEEVM